MKKIIFSLLATFGCSVGIMAQTDDNALRINFKGTGNPVETEHLLEGIHITFSEDGEDMNLCVNGAEVTYDLNNVSGMSHFNGTPQVALHANQDPDVNTPSFYTTFYSGLEAYTLPSGVKAYTAEIEEQDDETVVKLTAIEDDVLPQGMAVLLYSTEGSDFTMKVTSNENVNNNNIFDGVDMETSQNGVTHYMLSYGQNRLGFYKMNPDALLSANKAFIPVAVPTQAKAMRMLFVDDEANGINLVNDDDPSASSGTDIYSVSGIRQQKLQKGINIVGGKKIVVK